MSDLVHYKLKKLVQAPLLAAIDAEIKLNKHVKAFIIEAGFKKKEEPTKEGAEDNDRSRHSADEKYEFKTIEISYEVDGRKKTLQVPALSLITLPLLTLKEATFDMEITLLNQRKKNKKQKLHARPCAGKVNSLFPERKVLSNLKVNLKIQEADMPSGLQELYGRMNQLFNVK